jgi:Fe-S-cluster containining protein
MGDRCTGHCCQAFWISLPFERLAAAEDGEYLVDMLIPLGLQDLDLADGEVVDPPAEYYTCRHFDEIAGRCREYESRPQMCRRHGTEEVPCAFSGCALQDVVPLRAVQDAAHRAAGGDER